MQCEQCQYLLREIEDLHKEIFQLDRSLKLRTEANYKLRRTVERLALKSQTQSEHIDGTSAIRQN